MKSVKSNEKMKSNDKNKSRQHTKSTKKETVKLVQKPKSQPLLAFEVPELKALANSFDRQISSPIELQRSIFLSRTPQRCLLHNNVSTLYCLNDRQPLCVTCMYQNGIHKKHKVVPLNRANKEIEEQLQECLTLIDHSMEKTQYLIEKSQGNLQRAQKEFPQVIARISTFYERLRELIAQRQKEQIAHVEKAWTRVRHEYTMKTVELQRVHFYSSEQIKEIGQRNSEENLLYNRNVATNLVKIADIIKDDLCNYHETKYMEDLKKFTEVQKILSSKLVFTHPLFEPVSKQTQRSKSKSKQKSPVKNKSTIIKQKDADSAAPILRETNQNTLAQSPLPKNKHSPAPKGKVNSSLISNSPSPAKAKGAKTSVSMIKNKINESIERRY